MPPAVSRRRDVRRAALEIKLDCGGATERARLARASLARMPTGPAADVRPDGECAAGDDADGDGHDQATDKGGRSPRQDELEADPDQDQRPEPPCLHQDRRRDCVPVIGERQTTQNDQKDSPVEPTSVHSHIHHLFGPAQSRETRQDGRCCHGQNTRHYSLPASFARLPRRHSSDRTALILRPCRDSLSRAAQVHREVMGSDEVRLSQWRKAAPTEGAMNDRVLAVVGPVLADLGAERDPECWVAWGEEPDLRYSLLAPTLAGLITVAIRFTSPEDGPRVIAKLVRWSKVSVSELGLDSGGGHRMVAVQVENLVLKGMDEAADRICEFVRILIAGVDDRLQVPVPMTAVSGVAAPAATALRAPVRTSTPASAAVPEGGTGVEAERGAEGSPAPKTPKGLKPTPKSTASEVALVPAALTPAVPALRVAPKAT